MTMVSNLKVTMPKEKLKYNPMTIQLMKMTMPKEKAKYNPMTIQLMT